MAGGWSLNGIFTHFSGVPFTVTAAAGSCNCPGSQQIANQVLANVATVGNGVQGTPYFDPNAFAPVSGANFGTSSFNGYRGPGATDLDMSLFRNFSLTERLKMQIRAESFNLSNTPHFGNPVTGNLNVSNYNPKSANLGGFDQITQTQQLSRLLDQRYFRFGVRLTF